MCDETLDGTAVDGNVLAVHVVSADVLALDGTERACPHVERHLLTLNAPGVDVCEDFGREMQACRRRCHRTFYLGIYRLVGRLVALLRLAVEIWRDRQLACRIDDFRPRERPLEISP